MPDQPDQPAESSGAAASQERDHKLGMHKRIARRDFVNGAAVAVGALAATQLPGLTGSAAAHPGTPPSPHPGPPAPYPPAQTGLRGHHAGAFETAHSVRDGKFDPGRTVPTGERYDLVVVGGGISGLSAAWFFRKQHGRDARILVLDNHDDFGGHAKRNEFTVDGKKLISYGGTQSIDGPATYSRQARGLLSDLGIDLTKFTTAFDQNFSKRWKLGSGTFFDKQTFGSDALVSGSSWSDPAGWAAKTPLSGPDRAELVRLLTDSTDHFPGLDDGQKKAKLLAMSYEAYLRDVVRIGPQVRKLYQRVGHDLWGVGADVVPALDCWAVGAPGFEGLGLEETPYPGMGKSAVHSMKSEEPYIFHFPDGNASIARLLVRGLIPDAVPGHDMVDVVTAKARYELLDRSGNRVRIRLNSTAVHVEHIGSARRPRGVKVVYAQNGRTYEVRADNVVMACWNTMVPYLVPELPQEQKDGLAYGAKVPLVYTQVALRNWRAFAKLGLSRVSTPGMFYDSFGLDFPVSLGGYRFSGDPSEPVVVTVFKTPNKPGVGLSPREQQRAGRGQLYGTSFETFERELRDMFARTLGPGGFDPARDIAGITVNRWAHGYAYEYLAMWDPVGPDETLPYGIGRRTHGRIAIANSDSAGYAYTDAAIDEAYRAVRTLR